jgi:hypothetical protein
MNHCPGVLYIHRFGTPCRPRRRKAK